MSKVLGEQIIAQYWTPRFVQTKAFLEEELERDDENERQTNVTYQ